MTITDCDLGSPAAARPCAGPLYVYNVRDITLRNVRIAGRTYDTVLSDVRSSCADSAAAPRRSRAHCPEYQALRRPAAVSWATSGSPAPASARAVACELEPAPLRLR